MGGVYLSWVGRSFASPNSRVLVRPRPPRRVSALPETARLGARFPRAGSGRAQLPEPGVQYSRGLLWPLGPSALFPAPCCPCARRGRSPGVARAWRREG